MHYRWFFCRFKSSSTGASLVYCLARNEEEFVCRIVFVRSAVLRVELYPVGMMLVPCDTIAGEDFLRCLSDTVSDGEFLATYRRVFEKASYFPVSFSARGLKWVRSLY